MSHLVINPRVLIPESEIFFTFTRSSGAGGQNVNKVNTRVTLWFDVDQSAGLDSEQKRLIQRRLAARINRDGLMRVTSRRHRTQGENRQAAIQLFIALINQALKREKPRKKTRIPKAQKRKRLDNKRHRGRIKSGRGAVKNSGE